MGDANNANDADAKALHPVYSVTNIQNKVRILDGEKVTYSSWVKLFKLHAHGYDVLDHIDETPPPAATDPSYEAWSKIDSIVLQWIYGTLSDDLLVRVLEADSTAQQAWDRIKKMKDLADQLNDVDHLVSESRLVLQMLLGLPSEFDTVASFITQSDTSWDNAREMLDREQRRQATQQQLPSQPTLVAANKSQGPPAPMTHPVQTPHPHS
ncbi:uncharacterized protein LOC110932201 [Helianthus annuus]|uniref:uncharacterized protein LOC110932201 n=1 Tax=Helianthus annuus TaxID=4232 RepID=UPI000B905082|nr:uncharacterized protein LOC110932201 [Helianthus annuus]